MGHRMQVLGALGPGTKILSLKEGGRKMMPVYATNQWFQIHKCTFINVEEDVLATKATVVPFPPTTCSPQGTEVSSLLCILTNEFCAFTSNYTAGLIFLAFIFIVLNTQPPCFQVKMKAPDNRSLVIT